MLVINKVRAFDHSDSRTCSAPKLFHLMKYYICWCISSLVDISPDSLRLVYVNLYDFFCKNMSDTDHKRSLLETVSSPKAYIFPNLISRITAMI